MTYVCEKPPDIVIVAGDFNAQVARLSSSERNIGGRFSLDTRRTDNGERLLDFCSKHGLYLVSTNHRHKKSHLATWRSADPHHTLTQIDHIAVSYRWRGSVQNCRSFWSTPLDSDHALVLARFVLQFPGSKHIIRHRIDTHKLNDHDIREKYQRKISEKLTTGRSSNANEQWDTIRDAIKSSAEECCGAPTRQLDPWISQNSLNLNSSTSGTTTGFIVYNKTSTDESSDQAKLTLGSRKLVDTESRRNGNGDCFRKHRQALQPHPEDWRKEGKSK